MTTGIDLSRLTRPKVEGLQLSVDTVHEEILDWLAAQYDWTLTVDGSDPAWRLSRLFAAREAMIRQVIADSLAQASLAYADGKNRQQSDVVTVAACTRLAYTVTVTLSARTEPDSATVLAAARAGLADLARTVDVLGGTLTKELIAGAAVDPVQVLGATIAIEAGNPLADVDSIDGMDSVAPKAGTLTVTTA